MCVNCTCVPSLNTTVMLYKSNHKIRSRQLIQLKVKNIILLKYFSIKLYWHIWLYPWQTSGGLLESMLGYLYKFKGLSKYPHVRPLHLTTCLLTWWISCVWPKCSSGSEVKTTSVCRTFHYPMGHMYSVVKIQEFSELYFDFQLFSF